MVYSEQQSVEHRGRSKRHRVSSQQSHRPPSNPLFMLHNMSTNRNNKTHFCLIQLILKWHIFLCVEILYYFSWKMGKISEDCITPTDDHSNYKKCRYSSRFVHNSHLEVNFKATQAYTNTFNWEPSMVPWGQVTSFLPHIGVKFKQMQTL